MPLKKEYWMVLKKDYVGLRGAGGHFWGRGMKVECRQKGQHQEDKRMTSTVMRWFMTSC